MAPPLSGREVKAFYDRFGARQDRQAFYEDAATDVLIAHARFGRARSVFEFGCGTGRLAQKLLEDHLPLGCSYQAVDISDTMVGLAGGRLSRWPDRAHVGLSSGSTAIGAPDAAFDRFIATYVLDLLGDRDIRDLLSEARRVLTPDGLICLASLTPGMTLMGRLVSAGWRAVYDLNAKLVGGCRPIDLRRDLSPDDWRVDHHSVVARFGLCSQIIVASPRHAARHENIRT